LVLIAPAADFTRALLTPSLPPEARESIERDGAWIRPSQYDGDGYPITRSLLEDGEQWCILPGPVAITAPVRILQGGEDPDVPWTHALDLARALEGPNVVFTPIRDGDHRLSRPQDITRLIAAIEELMAVVG
jgi:pimeloyl-ACP methyl ester carboxylesterase